MKEKIFGAKRTIQRGMVIQLSIAIILVIILSAISLYIFTHQAIAKYMVFNIDTETARNEALGECSYFYVGEAIWREF